MAEPKHSLVGGKKAIPKEILAAILTHISPETILDNHLRTVCRALKDFIDMDSDVQKHMFLTGASQNHQNEPITKKYLVKFTRNANGRHLTARPAVDNDEPAEDEKILAHRIANPLVFRAAGNAGDIQSWSHRGMRKLEEFTGHVQCSWDVSFTGYTASIRSRKIQSYKWLMHICWPPVTEVEYTITCDEPTDQYNVPILGGRWNWEQSGTFDHHTGIRSGHLFIMERLLLVDLREAIARAGLHCLALQPRITWKIPAAYDPTI